MLLALPALWIKLLRLGHSFGDHKRGLDSHAPATVDEIVAVQELEGIVESLLAELGQEFGTRREQDPHEPVDVLPGDLDAGVGPVQVEELRALIARTNITFSAERADCDGVLVQDGQIVGKGAIHIADTSELGRQDARKPGNKAGTEQGLEHLLPGLELRNDHILAVVDSGEGDVQSAVDPFVGILGEVLLQALEQAGLDVEGGTEGAQGVATRLVHHPEEVRCHAA